MSLSCKCLTQPCSCPGVKNPPGKGALDYRASRYGEARERMLKLIASTAFVDEELSEAKGETVKGKPPLEGLTTRATSDASIAIIDAWAVACDVLSFYQERIANEGYLRTATERRSVLELARTIGYELAPGVSASAFLQFEVEDSKLSPGELTVYKGTAVAHVPQSDDPPQTFETSEDTEVKAAWNELRPRQYEKQKLTADMPEILVAGPVVGLARGDYVLIQPDDSNDDDGNSDPPVVAIVSDVTFSSETGASTIVLEGS